MSETGTEARQYYRNAGTSPVKTVLSGLKPAELEKILDPLPAYRAKQIFAWIQGGAKSFEEMSNLPLPLRRELGEKFLVRGGVLADCLEDSDGTKKLQLELTGGVKIETVLLSDGNERRTACLSTQAGCPAGCVFCKTGALGFRRNLSAAEIVEQFLFLQDYCGVISNLVIMGMGEPLYNLEELRGAIALFKERGISPRRITVSTSGVAEGIRDLSDKGPPVRLALSLTAAITEKRKALMPITKTNPLPLLKEALLYYQKKRRQRITLEAVLLGGINTGEADAEALASFARGLDAVVNLIPWNPVEGLKFQGRPLREPGAAECKAFADMLEKKGLSITRRYRKGLGIRGACGQLGAV